MAACYAENNLHVVGKDGVEIRAHHVVDSDGALFPEPRRSADERRRLYLAPMLCQQCDHAPCEPVCPVFASRHTEEGLNGQIYNRCVGTRYCENNCPYKVRRFNWFVPEWAEPLNLQLNPDVTGARRRRDGKMHVLHPAHPVTPSSMRKSKSAGARRRDLTACAQACPTRAITFGDSKIPRAR